MNYLVWVRWPWSHRWGAALTGRTEEEAMAKLLRLRCIQHADCLVLPRGEHPADVISTDRVTSNLE